MTYSNNNGNICLINDATTMATTTIDKIRLAYVLPLSYAEICDNNHQENPRFIEEGGITTTMNQMNRIESKQGI